MTDAPQADSAPRRRSPLRVVLTLGAGLAVVIVALLGFARHTMARDSRLAVGDLAPDFTLPDQTGAAVALGDVLASHRGAIVAFYPKDFTPG